MKRTSVWLLFVLSACSPAGNGDRRATYTIAGSGQPTVVFESGLGNSRLSWSSVYLPLATDTTVFAYDRPGMHWGIRGDFPADLDTDGPRSGEQAVEYLRGLLADAGVVPPYVIVGHSLGGQYALIYAKLFPDELVGLVLVDSRPANFVDACQEVLPPPAQDCVLSDEERAGMSEPLIAEALGMLETERRLPSAQELPDIPITVIVATEPLSPSEVDEALQRVWIREQRQYAQGNSSIRYVEAEGAGHSVHVDRPQLVIDEVRAVIDAVRGR